ncbi:MAG: 30S ribosomal protein S14, partial [Halobacteriovoraceae bacterium]|nr:30S ribosomal protein S14 [Halobacteriovoraceae bacterium]
KVSKIAANNRKRKQAEKYLKRRLELKKKMVDFNLSESEREAARIKLQTMPRNTSMVRVRNRCLFTGRSRGYLRQFRLSRLEFRRMALQGMISGITKSSW